MIAEPAAAPAGTNDTAGARRIARAFAAAGGAGRAALIPYVVAGYPDAETSFRIGSARSFVVVPSCLLICSILIPGCLATYSTN